MSKDSKIAVMALGVIGFVITCWLLFWGTVGTIIIHFVRKFW